MRRLSISKQLVILVLVLVLPLNLLSLLFAFQAQKTYVREYKDNLEHIIELKLSYFDQRVVSTNRYLLTAVDRDSYAITLMTKSEGYAYEMAKNFYWQNLYDRVQAGEGADAYFYYLPEDGYGNVAVDSTFSAARPAIRAMLESLSEQAAAGWHEEQINGEIWNFLVKKKGHFVYGAAFNLTTLLEDVQAEVGDKVPVSLEESGETDQTQKGIVLKITHMNRQITASVNTAEIIKGVPLLTIFGIFTTLVFLLAVPTLLYRIRRMMLFPMRDLLSAFGELGKGNLDVRLPETGTNEETVLMNRHFNRMAANLKDLRIQHYEQKIEQLKVETENVRLQVKPHFLLNCLNIIMSLAKSGDLEGIKKFTKSFSGCLHAILRTNSEKVSLGEEMKCVRNYIEVQKVRFPGRFTYLENLEPELLTEQIPSMLILSFVENATKHALDMDRMIEILVTARREAEDLVLSVIDTGNGIPENILQTINAGAAVVNETGKHIGIWNCKKRLAMLYGDRAYLAITSREREGTQIFIRIPIEKEEEKDDTADCG